MNGSGFYEYDLFVFDGLNIRPPVCDVATLSLSSFFHPMFSEPSSLKDAGASAFGAQIITTAAIDVHLPTNPAPAVSNPMLAMERVCSGVSDSSAGGGGGGGGGCVPSSHRCCHPSFSGQDPSVVVQELLSSLSEDSCLAQKGLAVDPVNLKLPSPTGSETASPELDNRINIFNRRNQEERRALGRGCVLLQTKPLIHLQGGATEPSLEEKYRLLGPADGSLGHMSDT